MRAQYLIFFGDKPYYITDNLSDELEHLAGTAGTIMANQPTPALIIQTIRDIGETNVKAVIILTRQVEHYWQLFREQFEPVTAAGGVVYNDKDEILFIYRRGYWDLPKGKWDEGETIAECAVREVEEETGLQEIILLEELGKTWHTYPWKGRSVLKTTVWYKMRAPGEQATTPQESEDIEAIQWVAKDAWGPMLSGTYASIRHILTHA